MPEPIPDIDRTDTPPGGPHVPETVLADGRVLHPSVRFEPRDVSYLGFLLVVVVAVYVISFTLLAVWWFFHHYGAHESAIKQSPFPLAPEPSNRLPREPVLEQIDRVEGVEKPNTYYREQSKEDVLNSLGPAGESGFAHVPIDRAMKAVAGQISSNKNARPKLDKSSGLLDAGAPNSGRIFREGPP
jgi:hypothetical protein